MTTLVFDIETDGLLDQMTKVHSLVIHEIETGLTFSCHDDQAYRSDEIQEWSISTGLEWLAQPGVTIVGHNIVDFDIPAIQKIYPQFKPQGRVLDTLIMSKLIWPNMLDKDFGFQKKRERRGKDWIKKHLFGRHSLESWGQRLGCWKGDYGQERKALGKSKGLEGDDLVKFCWGTWSQEMQDYCVQDVEVTTKLLNHCLSKGFSDDSIELEHDFWKIIRRQEAYGFLFDERKAHELYATLADEKASIERELLDEFKPWYRSEGVVTPKASRAVQQKHFKPIGVERYKDGREKQLPDGTPKYVYPKAQYTVDVPYTKVILKPFNPGSRQDISDRLIKLYGWKPSDYTPDGHPKVDEEVLRGIPFKPAKILNRYLLVQKRISQLAEGRQAWLKKIGPDGRIHGRMDTMGAVTSRCTHSNPNIGQVPGNGAEFGHQCRELFTVPTGKKLVGCDADALELRCLAGYMAAYDGGAYIKTVLEGNKDEGTDMHTLNAKALGCSRAVAKVWFYAFIYGAGDYKLGTILETEGPKGEVTNAGKYSRAKFLKSLPALKKLVTKVKAKAKRYARLRGLDGRILPVRSEHAALNTLLQSAGAILMKRACVILDNDLQAEPFTPGTDYEFVGNIHDEWQIEARNSYADVVGRIAAKSIEKAGTYYEFRCPTAGNYDVGDNWAETH